MYQKDQNGVEMNPNEIERQAKRIREILDSNPGFLKACASLSEYLHEIATKISSEDSELGNSIEEVAQTYKELSVGSRRKFELLATRMEEWATNSRRIEQIAADDINNLVKDLQGITDILNTIR